MIRTIASAVCDEPNCAHSTTVALTLRTGQDWEIDIATDWLVVQDQPIERAGRTAWALEVYCPVHAEKHRHRVDTAVG